MAHTTTASSGEHRALVVIDRSDLELLIVLMENELHSDPADHDSMPGVAADEARLRAEIHPRLRALRDDLHDVFSPPCTPHTSATRNPPQATIYDQDAVGERS